jgi:hypothetical protein
MIPTAAPVTASVLLRLHMAFSFSDSLEDALALLQRCCQKNPL